MWEEYGFPESSRLAHLVSLNVPLFHETEYGKCLLRVSRPNASGDKSVVRHQPGLHPDLVHLLENLNGFLKEGRRRIVPRVQVLPYTNATATEEFCLYR